MFDIKDQQTIFLQSLILGKNGMPDDEATCRQIILDLDYLVPPFQFVEVAPVLDTVPFNEKDRFIGLFQEYIECLLSDSVCWVYTDCFYNVGIIMSERLEDESFFIFLRQKLVEKFNIDIYIGVGSIVKQLSLINQSASEAKEVLAYKYQYGDKGVILHDNIVKFQYNALFASDFLFDRTINHFIECDIGKMYQSLNELVEHVRFRKNVSRTSIRRTLVELVIKIINIASNAGVDVDNILGDKDPYHWVMEQNHTEVITDWIMKLSTSFISEIVESTSTTEKRSIKETIMYIDRNIHDVSLSLQSISEHVGLTGPYLSQLFKNEIGIGINAFITLKRIERARYLLKNTELSLENVSNQCGFRTPQYFATVFKENVGMTPLAYRKS